MLKALKMPSTWLVVGLGIGSFLLWRFLVERLLTPAFNGPERSLGVSLLIAFGLIACTAALTAMYGACHFLLQDRVRKNVEKHRD